MYADINECANNSNDCDVASSYCVNTTGSYICICKSGYEVWIILVFQKFK